MCYLSVAVLYFDRVPLWGAFVASIGVGLLSLVIVHFVFVPIIKKKIAGECLICYSYKLCWYFKTSIYWT
jgi:hypothetical protein